MDPLAGFLDGPRARGAFLLRSRLDPPWALRIADGAPLTIMAVVAGRAVVTPDGGDPVTVEQGATAVIRGPRHYVVADAPGTPVQVIIGPDQVCTDLAGNTVAEQLSLGVRTWGTSTSAPTVLLTGTYAQASAVGRRLLDALATLPSVTTLPPGNAVIGLLADEIGHDRAGQPSVLDRLLDLLLVTTLREAFETQGSRWYAAYADPVVGPAMRLLDNNADHPWTLVELAGAIGISRAALARRFAAALGQGPIAYLTSVRMALAADLLADPALTVGAVARRVGYGNPFTFSTAFKRWHGSSPQHFRTN